MISSQVLGNDVANSQQLGRAGYQTIAGAGSLAETRVVVGVAVLTPPLVFNATVATPNLPDDADTALVNYTINVEGFVDWLGDLVEVEQVSGTATWIFA